MPSDNPPPHEFEDIAAGESGGASPASSSNTNEVIEDLSQRLREEQDGRREERFMFVIAGIILLNIHVMASFEAWTTPLIIGFMQLIGIIIYARRCGVEEVEKLVDKLLSAVPNRRE